MSEAAETVERIPLTIRDRSGKSHNRVLRARILEHPVRKQDPGTATASSNALEEDPWKVLVGQGLIIEPPYDLDFLSVATDNSTELGQNVRSMTTNTVSFGWTLREDPELTDETRKQFETEIAAERSKLRAYLKTVHPKDTLIALRMKVKQDKWQLGNGYIELIENARKELVGLNHIHGHTVRMTPLEENPILIDVPRVRPDQGYRIEQVPMQVRFRKFAQMWGTKVVWFKEAGDPRQLDKVTGLFAKQGEEIPMNLRATSLVHHRIYAPYSPYGVPVWMGNVFSYFGSRAAEEINFGTMSNNNVPSMFVIVENGVLTEDTVERLKQFVEAQASSSQNYSRMILLEGEPLEEGTPTPSSFKIKIEPLKQYQTTDQLFQEYDKNNRDKLRQCFRLPPIFVGRSDDYTRATADTSRFLADEQVFAPDRNEDDDLFNRWVMSAWGSRFHRFRSLNPNVTSDVELIQLMGISERSGAMTPRRANRIIQDVFGDDIGPMPVGLELDKPFSIQFAEAQGGGGGAGMAMNAGSGGRDATTRLVDGLLDIRRKVEKELTARYRGEG